MSDAAPRARPPRPARTSLTGGSTAPLPTVDSLKIALGIDEADTSHDAALDNLLGASIAAIENYCDRVFELGDYTQTFTTIDTRNRTLFLKAFPVVSVDSVQRDGADLTGWKLHAEVGELRQPFWRYGYGNYYPWWSPLEDADIVVTYSGGYPPDAWPTQLVDILNQLIADRWNATGGSGLYGDDTGAGGKVKGFTVDGVTVNYDVGNPSTEGASVTSGEIPPELAPYVASLNYYAVRRGWGI
jgi:hypothetical protein